MSETAVTLAVDERGVATLTLDRPDKRNAFDDAIIAQLDAHLASVAASPDIRILVLAATGKSFSAGADLGWMQRMAEYGEAENLADARALAEMLRKLNTLPQPTIARVQGAAFGGAVGLVSCCDLALGSSLAMFCLSEVKIGLIPATISPYVIAAMGTRAARRYFTTAEVIDAETAVKLGLLSELVGVDDLDAALEDQIENLLANGPAAVRAAKKLVLDYSQRDIDADLIEDSCVRIANIRVSEEGQDGLKAFLNKQDAPWRPRSV